MRSYFPRNREESIWDFQMLDQLKAHLESTFGFEMAQNLWAKIDVPAWIYTKAELPYQANFNTTDSDDALKLSKQFRTVGKLT